MQTILVLQVEFCPTQKKVLKWSLLFFQSDKMYLISCQTLMTVQVLAFVLTFAEQLYLLHYTMRAGHYENRKESVAIMIHSSRAVINHLLAMGVRFEKNADGSLVYTREGAHSQPRICFHKDITGEEITTTLLSHVYKLENVTIMEYTTMIDLMEQDGVFNKTLPFMILYDSSLSSCRFRY